MELQSLTAISPIDGRYRHQLSFLDEYFSEYALIKARVKVEILYFIFLSEKKFFKIKPTTKKALIELNQTFSVEHAQQIKEIERTTNHDVKAVEYFLKDFLKQKGEEHNIEWVHFGLTSQDINNTAIPHLLELFTLQVYIPFIIDLIKGIKQLAKNNKKVSMLARTHGQAASPTTLGKEMMVFAYRIEEQLKLLALVPFSAKFGGATGNFNAHKIAFKNKDWIKLANEFCENELMLERQQYTTQIDNYDNLAAMCQSVARINTILIDFCRDLWQYISMDYFTQKIKANEVGSSAMPHKVNPIDFENAEGNLGIANAVLQHLAAKLPISRLQRDLTDSTVLRNIGVPLAHTILSFKSIEKGLSKLVTNETKINEDLENNWAVVTEAIQTILRRENYPNAYEALKAFSRGDKKINKTAVHKFIDSLNVNATVKKEMKAITPQNYIGVAFDF